MRYDYPVGTMILCIMVGGDLHGQSYVRFHEDAFQFTARKLPPLPVRFYEGNISDSWLDPPETIHYQPFAEMWSRLGPSQYIRYFSVNGEPQSMLFMADAMRMAKVDFV